MAQVTSAEAAALVRSRDPKLKDATDEQILGEVHKNWPALLHNITDLDPQFKTPVARAPVITKGHFDAMRGVSPNPTALSQPQMRTDSVNVLGQPGAVPYAPSPNPTALSQPQMRKDSVNVLGQPDAVPYAPSPNPTRLQQVTALRQAQQAPTSVSALGQPDAVPYAPSPNPTRLQQAPVDPTTDQQQAPTPVAPVPPPSPAVAATAGSPADPYNKAAADYTQRASTLETQAAAPMPQPHGFKENLVSAARAAMENFGRLGAPGGYYGQEEQRKADYLTHQNQQLAQAKEFRGLADTQQKMGETATSDQARIEELKQLRAQQEASAAETSRHNQVMENAPEKLAPEDVLVPRAGGAPIAVGGPKPLKGSMSPETVIYNGKPTDVLRDLRENSPTPGHTFLQQGADKPLLDITGQTTHYEKPTSADETTQILSAQGVDGKPVFYRVPKKGPEGPIQTAGGGALAPKAPDAPTQMKNQADAAKSTKDQIAVIRQVMKDHPELTGPVIGRAAEVMLKFGGDPGGILAYANGQPEGFEKNTAMLASHLTYLFMNEARATSPGGRIPQNMLELIKSRSAAIAQNPQIMEGFLQSAENNANIQLHNAASAGYDPFKIGQTQQPGAGIPQVGGTFNGAKVLKVTPIP